MGISGHGSIVVNPYKDEDAKPVKGFMVEGEWWPPLADYFRAEGIEALYLNHARGWTSRIEGAGHHRGTRAGAQGDRSSFGPGAARSEHSREEDLDLSGLRRLRRCFTDWWKGLSGLGELSGIERLYLSRPPAGCGALLRKLTGLETLIIGQSPLTDLSFLCDLPRLRVLELLLCRKLADFGPISACARLTRLRIEGSKGLTRLDFVSRLRGLEVLLIGDNGEIDSLAPLAELVNLKALAFQGARTVIKDGNLAPLEKLPRLAMLMFAPRKHYTHKLVKAWNWNDLERPDRLLERNPAITPPAGP